MKKLSKTASTIIWAFAYFGLVVALTVSGCVAFHRYYYCSVFVSGTSMEPTLMGGGFQGNSGTAHYGIIDVTDHALKGIKRFDIITTYYPWDKTDYALEVDPETGEEYYKPGHSEPDGVNPDRKIKRVIGLPGETLRIINGDIIISKIPTIVSNPEAEKNYKIGFLPYDHRSCRMQIFKNADSNCFYCDPNFDLGFNVSLEKANKENEYYFRLIIGGEYRYVNIKTKNENIVYSFEMVPSTIWTFSKEYNTITTKVTTFGADYSDRNGEYLFTDNVDKTLYKIGINKISDMKKLGLRPANLMERNDSETFVYSRELIKGNETYINYDLLKKYKNNYTFPFERKFDNRDFNIKDQNYEVVLMEGRYWVQGDHWSSSTDCGDAKHGPIYYENIEGVLVAIEGTCTIKTDENGKKECVDHKRMIPRLL